MKNFIYAFIDKEKSLIKIGSSKNPLFRKKTIESSLKTKLDIFYVFRIPKDTLHVEFFIHAMLDKYRVNGEWFLLNNDVVKYLNNFSLIAYCNTKIFINKQKEIDEGKISEDLLLKEYGLEKTSAKDKLVSLRVCSLLLDSCLKKSGINTSDLINTLLSEYASGTISLCKNSKKVKSSKRVSNI
jgi:hypothetical protein